MLLFSHVIFLYTVLYSCAASDEVLSVQPAKLIPESSTSKSKNENVSDQEGASGGGGMTTEEKMKLLSQYD